VALSFTDSQGHHFARRGEFVATATGVEGSLIYAVSSLLRDEISAHGHATFHLDLLPQHSPERVLAELRHPRGARSLASHLKGRLGLDGIKAAILYEQLGKDGVHDAGQLAFEALDAHLMLQALPGVFCAGEMLDWEAPTGGYLLSASCASGRAAGAGAVRWLELQK
jgi:predicted flavoprotein YhiN